jgi:hypothetical protein
VLGQNAIVNGNAENGTGSTDGSIVTVPGWSPSGQFTVVKYGAGGGFVTATDPGPTDRGNNFFAGGPSSSLSTGTQTIDLFNIAADVNSGAVDYVLSGYLGGFATQSDNAVLTANFLNSTSVIGSASIGPITESDRGGVTGLLFRTTSGTIPVGTTSINFDLVSTRFQGSYDDGYADNLSFVAISGSPAAIPEPATIFLLALGSGVLGVLSRRRKIAS